MHAEWRPARKRQDGQNGQRKQGRGRHGPGHGEVSGVNRVCVQRVRGWRGEAGGICLLFNLPSVRHTTARVPN